MADERFSGDMSRNEVEIDLNKFMELVTENSNLKAEILKLESEKEPENPDCVIPKGVPKNWGVEENVFVV